MAVLTNKIGYIKIPVEKIYNNMLKQLMDTFYFNEKEAKVYLANLELGRSRVSLIAKKAGLNRITTYDILKKLIGLGIASSAFYNGVKTFQVIEPELLLEKMESRMKLAKQILPQLLLASRMSKVRPDFQFFEGAEGIRTIYEDTLNCREKIIYNIANPKNLLEVVSEQFFNQYVKKRVRRKIKVMVLMPDSSENKKYKKETKNTMREVRFFAKENNIPNEILMYDNKLALLSFSSNIGVIVEDTEIVESMKSLWKMLWRGAS